MSISKIKENAKEALKGKWGKGALITLAYLVIFWILGTIQGLFGENSMTASILGIVTAIIEIPLTLGLTYAFIKLKRGEEVKAFDFLEMGFSNFGRAWKISLRTLLKLIVPVIGIIGGMLMVAGSAVYFTANYIDANTVNTPAMIVMLVGIVIYIAAVIWCVIRSLLYSVTVYVAYDNPNMNSLEVVNESEKLMNGNRGKIFLLELSFIGWAILCIFTLGIGYLWLMAYVQVALVCFYENLLGKKEENENNTVESDNNPIVEN